jgi:5-methylcytosine-specific restriction endonuclease McrA
MKNQMQSEIYSNMHGPGIIPVQNYLSLQVLRTDISGMPLEWINYREAARLHHLDQIAYTLGSILYELHGGINSRSGMQSTMQVHSIIATQGNTHVLNKVRDKYTPPLNNRTLFKRDGHLCLYCGKRFLANKLSRDHVNPISQGGHDTWNNVVTACRRCNNHKAGNTPEQARMQLLAIPFTPNHAEYIYLKGRKILADQMEFLQAHFPRSSPLRARKVFELN